MTTQEKLQVIYDKISDKTLSFGCRVILVESTTDIQTKCECIRHIRDNLYKFTIGNEYITDLDIIIGHHIHIGRVLWWLNERKLCMDYVYGQLTYSELLIRKREKLDQPLLFPGENTEGWEELIDFIYGLICDE